MTKSHIQLAFVLLIAVLHAPILFAQTDAATGATTSVITPPLNRPQFDSSGSTKPPTAIERLFGAATNKATDKTNQNTLSTSSKPASLSNEPLPVEQAFKISANRKPTGVSVRLDAAVGYYLYREKIKILDTDKQTNVTPVLPKGEIIFDETFGKNVATFRGVLSIPEIKLPNLINNALSIDVYSQGCADIGVCYPPQYHRLTFPPNQVVPIISDFEPPVLGQALSIVTPQIAKTEQKAQSNIPPLLPTSLATNATTVLTPKLGTPADIAISNEANLQAKSAAASKSPTISEQDSSFSQLFKNTHPVWLAIVFMGLGLLLTFTPCVLPMLPIVSAIVLGKQSIGSTSDTVSTKQALQRSACYVLGMCVTYTAVGVLAGLAGQGLSGFLQQPWVLYTFAALMVVLAGAQFGWYNIALPSVITDKLGNTQNQLQHAQQSGAKHYAGIALMGALSALMIGPCLTAPLAGALSYIAQTGDAWLGGLALFGLSLGMGIPLLAISVGGARFLPKAGAWMSQVNYGFGLMLLAVALWMLQSLLPSWLFTGLCVSLLLLIAQALGAFQVFASQPSTRLTSLLGVLGLLVFVWALAIVWGMAAGRFDPISPLREVSTSNSSTASAMLGSQNSPARFETIAAADVAARLNAKPTSNLGTNKPILLDFYADWCVSCIEFERFTFTDSQVAAQLSAFTLLRVDVTNNTIDDRALLKQFGLFGPPAILFFKQSVGTSFSELRSTRVIGFQAATQFLQQLQAVLSSNR